MFNTFQICVNLLSVSQMVKKGNEVIFDSAGCRIYNSESELLATGMLVNDMFKLNTKSEVACVANSKFVDLLLWHKRFAPANMNALNSMLKIKLKIDDTFVVCTKGKLARKPFNENGKRATKLFEIIHSDVCGPISENSLGGAKYFVTFTDDYSRKIFAYAMKPKGEVFFKIFTIQEIGGKLSTFFEAITEKNL